MKIRIKFSKQGVMKFIGHLDVMRYFQKAIRRADIDIAFSEGFSPHMIMSFAAPLGVGLTSDGEYMDIEVRGELTSKEAVKRLNRVMVDGMHIHSYRQIPEQKTSKAMSLVAAADYTVRFRDQSVPAAGWSKKVNDFFAQESIIILKKTKKSEQEVDIRPMIYRMSVKDEVISMQLATGSVNNLKPELVMEAFAGFLGTKWKPFALEVNRVEIYADIGTDMGRKLISLEDLGEEIGT